MACNFCDWINGVGSSFRIYQDDTIVAMLHPRPATNGHIIVMPIKHYTIIEQVPDRVIEEVFVAVNKLSTLLVEKMGIQGVNILVNNGVSAGQVEAHFMVSIIPRIQGDGIDFNWAPRQMGEEELSSIELKIKEVIGGTTKPKLNAQDQTSQELSKLDDNILDEEEDEENYMIRALDRIP